MFPQAKRIHLEVGYGGGEHLARMARENPQDGFIGCEVFTGGIGKLLETIDVEGTTNIALFPDDVIKLLAVMPDASLIVFTFSIPTRGPSRAITSGA